MTESKQDDGVLGLSDERLAQSLFWMAEAAMVAGELEREKILHTAACIIRSRRSTPRGGPGDDSSAPGAAPLSGWQPIETAPKDGSKILLGTIPQNGDEHYCSTLGWYVEAEDDMPDSMGHDAGFVDHEYQWFRPARPFGNPSYRDAGRQPTHWQPLPEAPKD